MTFPETGQAQSPAIPVQSGTLAAAGLLVMAGAGVLIGWAVTETTGLAAATVDLVDGNDANGELIARVTLTAGQSSRDTTGPVGLAIQRGLFVNVAAGSASAVCWVVRG